MNQANEQKSSLTLLLHVKDVPGLGYRNDDAFFLIGSGYRHSGIIPRFPCKGNQVSAEILHQHQVRIRLVSLDANQEALIGTHGDGWGRVRENAAVDYPNPGCDPGIEIEAHQGCRSGVGDVGAKGGEEIRGGAGGGGGRMRGGAVGKIM